MIDRLQKKWVARSLFFLVFALLVVSIFWPLGDPDMNKLLYFAERSNAIMSQHLASISLEATAASATAAALAGGMSSLPELPPVPIGNILYLVFQTFIFFCCLLVAYLYGQIYIAEQLVQTVRWGLKSYFRRLPITILFLVVLFIITIFALTILLGTVLGYVFLAPLFYILLALLFVPLVMMTENKNLFDAISYSFRYTKGKKLGIFLHITLLYFAFIFIAGFGEMLFPHSPNAIALLSAFFLTYFVLAFGRLLGIVYTQIRIQSSMESVLKGLFKF